MRNLYVTLIGWMFAIVMDTRSAVSAKRPNIIMMVGDDVGWNDIGYHNSEVISPNIDALIQKGIFLNQSYVQPVCTPTRGALLTGRYPFKTGTQHGVILPDQPACLPTHLPLLPQRLKELNYSTYALGKWHLGMCSWNCTPTARGFDSFLGFMQGAEHHFNHTTEIVGGYDFWRNRTVFKDAIGTYTTEMLTVEAYEIFANHAESEEPFFMYMSYPNVHSPLEVDEFYTDMYPNITDPERKKYLGMLTNMDESIGAILQTLLRFRLYENTIMLFTSDNGGQSVALPPFSRAGSASNYPLRGGKSSVFEGGTRVVGFLHSPLIPVNTSGNFMVHAVDWYPTLLEAAGGKLEPGLDEDIDGISLWGQIMGRPHSPTRDEFVYQIDSLFPEVTGAAAIRVGDWKLVIGLPGTILNWDKPTNSSYPTLDGDSCLKMNYDEGVEFFGCLFNVKDDPSELHDLWHKHPDVVNKLRSRLDTYRTKEVKAKNVPNDPAADPSHWGGVRSPGWCDM